MTPRFADTLASGLAGYGDRPFLEFERKWHAGNEITHYIARITAALTTAGVGDHDPVGIVVRNRVPHAAAILGFIAAERPVAVVDELPRNAAMKVRPGDVAALDDTQRG